jgi:hypothetical protein
MGYWGGVIMYCGCGGGAYAGDCIVGVCGIGVDAYCGAGVITARGAGGAFDAIVGGALVESMVAPRASAGLRTDTWAAGCAGGITGANDVCP